MFGRLDELTRSPRIQPWRTKLGRTAAGRWLRAVRDAHAAQVPAGQDPADRGTGTGAAAAPAYRELGPESAIRMAYNVVLRREPDPGGLATYLPPLTAGDMTHDQLVEWLMGSEEFHAPTRFTELGPSLHLSRCEFIQSLPRASRIVDLGGTHLGRDVGAFVALGYPYRFDELTIIDLPLDERHPLYQQGGHVSSIETDLGPVTYRYHSMVDLAAFPDGSIDLIYSGQTIEHITEPEADHVLAEAMRILRPGGHMAIDTPNGRATRMQQDEFIDPDHEVEYTHQQLSSKIRAAGLEIVDAKGLNYLGDCLDTGEFSVPEVARHQGLYDAIEDCYLLAYVCRRP